MRPRILLFDIDGTLIRSGGAGARALERAVSEAFAIGDVRARFSFAGGTDPAIFRRLLSEHGIEPSEDALARTFAVYLDILREEIERAPSYRVIDGIEDALEALAAFASEPIAVGLGTGNVEQGARIKLARGGLNRHFPFGGFGSDAEDRAELLRAGAARGAARLGCEADECDVLVVGDTPLDVSAAHAIGARCLAVTTGGGTRDTLTDAGADHLFDTLSTPAALTALLEG